MARLVELQSQWSRGMKQDFPRSALPRGSSWSMVDWIPDLGAPLRKRGGWSYASPSLSATAASGTSATYVAAVQHVPFPAGNQLVAITDGGRLIKVTSVSSASDMGAGVVPIAKPVLYLSTLVIPASDGTTAPKKYDGSSVSALGGSPPAGKYAAVYKDRVVLAATSASANAVFFSAAAKPESWDLNSYVTTRREIKGLAALTNAIMVFQSDSTARIRGTVPPYQGQNSDMIVDDPIFNVGCSDARSIAVIGQYAMFANTQGVWRTNGTNIPENLTESAGLSTYWSDLMASYTSSWVLAGATFRNYYVLSVMNGSTFVDAFMFDMRRPVAYRVSNLKAMMMSSGVVVGEELYVAHRSSSRVLGLASMFSPAAGVKADADGTAVTPVVETPLFGGDTGKKTWRAVVVDYDLRDAASDNPTVQVSYIKNPGDAYTAVSSGKGGVLAETTGKSRARVSLLVPSDAVALKFAQSNASSDTMLYSLNGDVHARESSRL